MRAINHALAGAAIGLTVSRPELALPLALVSHFVLDAVPHFGSSRLRMKSEKFRLFLIIDAILCGLLVITLAVTRPQHWLVAAVCAFLAASPDFMWVGKFLRTRANMPPLPNHSLIERFHGKIQWFERPSGALVEAVWLVAMIVLIRTLT